jgi:oligosaccharide 4-alpha-D-glucosyltransferase
MKHLLFCLLITSLTWAQNAHRKFVDFNISPYFYTVSVSDGTYHISFYNDDILETSFVPKNEAFSTLSHAIAITPLVTNPSKVKVNNEKELQIETGNLKVIITKSPFQITYYHHNTIIVSEKLGYFKKKHEPLDNVKGNIIADSTEVIQLNIEPSEVLFGGGARAMEMNRRGHKLALFNRAHYGYETHSELMNFCIPMVISSKKYAIHFDNPSIGYLDLDSKKNNTLEYETLSGRKTYQLIAGDSWETVMKNYTFLTGRQPLPPRWIFGNFASRFGYRDQEATEKTVRQFQENHIALDAIILDLYWFGKTIKGTMGNLDWDQQNFPEPYKMLSDFNKKNIKTILVTEPFILTTSSKWEDAVAKEVVMKDHLGQPATWDFYFGNTGLIDIFKPKAREWFWSIYKNLAQQGVGGVWGDLGEPEVLPNHVYSVAGKADKIHNIYGHNWAKLIFEGYSKDFPNQRPFILMRAGYSGSQKYGMLPWSGDVNRTWGGLKSQMGISLQMGMQGIAYMHSDLGGFAGEYYDNELYLRWLQYGVFQPIFRPHAQEEIASEVAKKDIITREKARKAVELRYQMLPYNYTLAYKNTTTGMPLMQPLFFEESNNEALLNEKESYLWGRDFLIKPITNAGVTTTTVYFPKSGNWFDFYSGKKYKAGTTETVAVTELSIPTFVRGSVFYPMIKPIQNTEEYNNIDLDLHLYYEGKQVENREFYFDKGNDPNALSTPKSFEILSCRAEVIKKNVTIYLESHTTSEELLSHGKMGTIHLYHFVSPPKSVSINGTHVAYLYNKKTKTLQFDYRHINHKTKINIAL